MCLIKKSLIPRIAITNKTVYKVITKDFDGTLYTPCRYSFIEIHKTYKGLFYPKRNLFTSLFSRRVDDGFIHVWATLENARKFKFHINPRKQFGESIKIVKCIIPKGTFYYIGDNKEIATRKLTYIDFVE